MISDYTARTAVQLSPDATYDALVIVRELSAVSGGATDGEVSLFAYLACLLSVYKGNPPSGWGYRFVATHSASPFSEDLSQALRGLVNSSLVSKGDSGLILTKYGISDLKELETLNRFASRNTFLDAACGSSLVIPLPIVGESISAEPMLRRALALSSRRELLGEGGHDALLEHFRAVGQAVPEASDLLIPAIVWLEYLASTLDDASANGTLQSAR